MPVAPRPGRKGGKISSSPATAAENATPNAVSPATLAPGLAPGMPSDPAIDLEFKIGALMDSKRGRSKAKEAREGSAKPGATDEKSAANGGAAAATTSAESPATGSFADANVFKFDMDAIDQIGQGVVIGGNKTVRTDSRKPEAAKAEVNEKLLGVLGGQKVLPERVKAAAAPNGVSTALSSPVVIVKRPHDALTLAAAISKADPPAVGAVSPKVLVVVPKYFEVASVADSLRAISAGAVGELCGQSFSGPQACRLWVAAAETAFTYLRAQKSLAPFTHMVVPGLSRMTPLAAYFLWGLRERVFRQSANLDPNAPPLHLVMCVNEGNVDKIKAFFAEQDPVVDEPVFAEAPVEFSYDEANAMADMNVLEVEVDASGKFPGPHRKLVDHATKLATKIITSIIGVATTPQCIYVMTADMRDTVEALQAAALPNTAIFSGRNSAEDGGRAGDSVGAVLAEGKSCVVVMPTVLHFAEASDEVVHFVLDMGTTRRLSQQTKSESFMTGSSSEWASAREIQQHKDLLTPFCAGGYFALYPPGACEVFRANDKTTLSQQAPIFETEDALLQCCRAQVPVGLCHDMLVPADPDTLEQVVSNLAEKCLVASPQDLSITFLGEVVARLPLETDLAHFVINGSAIGLGEAAVVIASVCSLPYRTPMGASPAEVGRWKEAVLESRRKYAGDIAHQSDILADAMVYLEWCKLKVQGRPTQALVEELHVYEQRFEQIQVLMAHLRLQLSDYVFIDELDNAAVLDEVQASIKNSATIFTFLESVSLARRVSFVRDAGNLNLRDRAAALTFVRTSKKLTPMQAFPSSVPWEVGAALVSVDLRNYATFIGCSRISVVSTAYLFSSLLLLYPQVEYSEPAEVAGKSRVVYMGVTCNRQMKRFRVSIEEAAAILDFRQKWNAALGYLQALRTRRHPISRRRFELELKEKDRAFDLSQFYTRLQRDFVNLVTELEVTEHQGSFTTFATHCLSPSTSLAPVEGCEASDVKVTKRFHDGDLWRTAAHAPSPGHVETPAAQADGGAAVAAMSFPTQGGTLFDDEDDEIEFIAESYFMQHGPIIDEDDD